jgi:hypothetical protein
MYLCNSLVKSMREIQNKGVISLDYVIKSVKVVMKNGLHFWKTKLISCIS